MTRSRPAIVDDHDAIAALIRSYEVELLDHAARKDRARVAALLTEDFVEFGSSGRVWTRDGILDLLATEAFQPHSMEDFACHIIADRTVLATYKTARTDSATGRRFVTLRSSIWIRDSGRWLLRFHQGTPAS